ncbi:hypothetical protein GCM10010277_06320 [Streptomyces longisporoflavus]|nr:hypothetical protein GCM10010277_06320 [Streptomyces longisporoflavus]
MDGGGLHGRASVVVSVQQVPLGGPEQIEAGHGQGGVGRHLAQDAGQPLGEGLDVGAVEELTLVLNGHPEAGFGADGDRQRVVGAGGRADARDLEAFAGRVFAGHALAARCVGFRRHQGVEQDVRAGGPVDVGEAAVVTGKRLLSLPHSAQQTGHCVRGRDPDPHRERVDEQPRHRCHAGHRAGAAGHGRAEHHVLLPGQPGEQQRPGALNHRLQGNVRLGRQVAQVTCDLGGKGHLDLVDPRLPMSIRHWP